MPLLLMNKDNRQWQIFSETEDHQKDIPIPQEKQRNSF